MLHCPVVKRLVIAVDGPSGAGKGTVARAAARALGYRHVDTGAMYRAVAWEAMRRQLRLDAHDEAARLAADAALEMDEGRICINGHDVTAAIRTPDIDQAAAIVARIPAVRDVLVDRQRAIGRDGGVVMEGRDIGTVVFPSADVKIYLDASPAGAGEASRHRRRAQRRPARRCRPRGRTSRRPRQVGFHAQRGAFGSGRRRHLHRHHQHAGRGGGRAGAGAGAR